LLGVILVDYSRVQNLGTSADTVETMMYVEYIYSNCLFFNHFVLGILGILFRCLMNMMRAMHEEGIHTHHEAKAYIGKTFKARIYDVAPWTTDEEICDFIIK
jgi:hypothetical protein